MASPTTLLLRLVPRRSLPAAHTSSSFSLPSNSWSALPATCSAGRVSRPGLGLALICVIFTTAAIAVRRWEASNRQVLFERYYWERGRCYGVQVISGAVTKSKVPTPDGYCPRVDWNHPPADTTWKAVVDCSFSACPADSLFANSISHTVSKIGGGPTPEEACQNAEFYLNAALVRERCLVKACHCEKTDTQGT